MLGWSIDKVKKYAALKDIDKEAWALIVPTFEELEKCQQENDVTSKVPNGTFTEGLLRQILNLTPTQQLQLVSEFASGGIGR